MRGLNSNVKRLLGVGWNTCSGVSWNIFQLSLTLKNQQHSNIYNSFFISLDNRGKTMVTYDIPPLIGKAFPKAMTPINIQFGFRVSGIYPFVVTSLEMMNSCHQTSPTVVVVGPKPSAFTGTWYSLLTFLLAS